MSDVQRVPELPPEGETVLGWYGGESYHIVFYGRASFNDRVCWRFDYDHAATPEPDGWVPLPHAKAAGRLAEALRFYAEPKNYTLFGPMEKVTPTMSIADEGPIYLDGGERARAVLDEIGGG